MTPHYDHDGVTLYHGDCVDVLPAAGVKANLILTSPPYGEMRTFGGHGFDFDSVADACVGALADGGVLVWQVGDCTVNGSETGDPFRQALGFMERGLRLHDTMIFEKAGAPVYSNVRYMQSFEYMFVLSAGTPSAIHLIADRKPLQAGRVRIDKTVPSRDAIGVHSNIDKASITSDAGVRSNIWRYVVGYNNAARDYLPSHEHPAIFPYALAADHIRTWTNPGDVVLDPMAGSGTTLRAAKDLGRLAVGVEIHADYLPIITGRMAQSVMALA